MRTLNITKGFCMNHAIHLAVCDTLYKKVSNSHLEAELDSNGEDENNNFEEVNRKYCMKKVMIFLTSAHDVIRFIRN